MLPNSSNEKARVISRHPVLTIYIISSVCFLFIVIAPHIHQSGLKETERNVGSFAARMAVGTEVFVKSIEMQLNQTVEAQNKRSKSEPQIDRK